MRVLTSPARILLMWLTVGLAGSGSPAAHGGTVIQNDSVVDFGSVAIQVGFAANERGGAWLTSPCDGGLTAVQVLWLDGTSSGTQTLGDSITISAAGSFPVPGTTLAQLVAPLMTEGFFNEFALDPPVAVATGETVVVDFKFLESPPPDGPSLVTDIDGCQAAKNGIFAIPPSAWIDACALGVSGDFAIRGVVDCGVDTLIFADGFESGDTSAWSSEVPLLPSFPVLRIDPGAPPFWERRDLSGGERP